MGLHDDLLALARRLVPPFLPTNQPQALIIEADLRRGVSTAYYALFHLLVHEAMARIVADPRLRSRVGRSESQSHRNCGTWVLLSSSCNKQGMMPITTLQLL